MSRLDLVRGINVADLTDYLRRAGWKQKTDHPRKDVLVFAGPPDDDGEPIDFVFPRIASAPSFSEDVARVIDALAIIENREFGSVAHEIRLMMADRLRVRLSSESTQDGTLPLKTAIHMVSGLRSLLVAAARMESDPAPSHTVATKRDTQFGDACRLGQTEPGSFIINIEIPVPRYADGMFSFPRRVLHRIMFGLHVVTNVREPSQVVRSYEKGMNANMLEAMLELRPDSPDFGLDISTLSSARLPQQRDTPSIVQVGAQHFDIMEDSIRQLRALSYAAERTYQGRVRALNSSTGQVNIDVDDKGNRYLLHAYLDPGDYRTARRAHDTDRDVVIKGQISRHGPQRWIDSVTAFKLSSDEG